MISNFVPPVLEKSDNNMDFLSNTLVGKNIFNTLDEGELETLVNAFENYECNRGKKITK